MHTRLAALVLIALAASPAWSQGRGTAEHWVTTWATAVVARVPAAPVATPAAGGPGPGATASPVLPAGPVVGRAGGPPAPAPLTVDNQTIRQIVHVSVGGSRARVVLSNAFGTAPIQVGAAHVALRGSDSSVVPESVRPLTVNGGKVFTILPGATLVSDPVELTIAPLSDLAIDLYLPGELGTGSSPLTVHNGALQTGYLMAAGNHSGVVVPAVASRPTVWMLLARVEVVAPPRTGTVVLFGDSITDGTRSTSDMNARWPDVLARRLAAQKGGLTLGMANQGIAGNRLLGDGAGVSALARFDRDVLVQTGVTHVVVLEGINDIGVARSNRSPSADDLIGAHQQLIARAHARGLTIYGATLTPFEGAGYFTPEGEAKRQALNTWIRTSGAYDGVIDFDKATRDPMAPSTLNPAYDSGDHLHPNDAGYKAMAEAIDLRLFQR